MLKKIIILSTLFVMTFFLNSERLSARGPLLFQNLSDPDEFFHFPKESKNYWVLIYMPAKCKVCNKWVSNVEFRQLMKKSEIVITFDKRIWRTSRKILQRQEWPSAIEKSGFADVGRRFKEEFSPNKKGEFFIFKDTKKPIFRSQYFQVMMRRLDKLNRGGR